MYFVLQETESQRETWLCCKCCVDTWTSRKIWYLSPVCIVCHFSSGGKENPPPLLLLLPQCQNNQVTRWWSAADVCLNSEFGSAAGNWPIPMRFLCMSSEVFKYCDKEMKKILILWNCNWLEIIWKSIQMQVTIGTYPPWKCLISDSS